MRARGRNGVVGLIVGLLLVASFTSQSVGETEQYGTSLAPSSSESVAVARVKWTSNVTVSLANGSWTFKSSGLPASNFEATAYAVPSNPLAVNGTGANVISASSILRTQSYNYTLPLKPEYAKRVTTANQGPIGFLLDGAALFNPYEANHSTVATSDNFDATVNGVTASFIDSCDGHPGPGGQYHYHGLPSCLVAYATGVPFSVSSVTSLTTTKTAAVSEVTKLAKKPVVLGFAFDGYGIYDNVAMNGKTVPVSSLDQCNGIDSPVPGYPKGVYHYVLENVKGTRSSVNCYHGVVSSAYTRALQNTVNAGDGSAQPAVSSQEVAGGATARSLAADTSYDSYLQAVLSVSSYGNLC